MHTGISYWAKITTTFSTNRDPIFIMKRAYVIRLSNPSRSYRNSYSLKMFLLSYSPTHAWRRAFGYSVDSISLTVSRYGFPSGPPHLWVLAFFHSPATWVGQYVQYTFHFLISSTCAYTYTIFGYLVGPYLRGNLFAMIGSRGQLCLQGRPHSIYCFLPSGFFFIIFVYSSLLLWLQFVIPVCFC